VGETDIVDRPVLSLRHAEHSFATIDVVPPADVAAMRRSLAIGGTLGRADIEALLDAVDVLLVQRAAVERILAELGPSWASTRRAFSEWARVVAVESMWID
jgi:hypothetical protein